MNRPTSNPADDAVCNELQRHFPHLLPHQIHWVGNIQGTSIFVPAITGAMYTDEVVAPGIFRTPAGEFPFQLRFPLELLRCQDVGEITVRASSLAKKMKETFDYLSGVSRDTDNPITGTPSEEV